MPLPGVSHYSCFSFFLFLQGRSHLNHEKEVFAQDHPEVNSLEEVVKLVKPTAIIGRRREAAHCPVQLTFLISGGDKGSARRHKLPMETQLFPLSHVQFNATNFY